MLFMVLHCTYILLLLVILSSCSLILDSPGHAQNLKYCGQIGECKPGEHVMCMFYRPERTMGPKCTGEPIELTKGNKLQIMSKINQMRSDTAHGNVTGKDNILLPKGYGLKQLEWDDELARFAQIWANQCSFKSGDLCRATERFPNPGQFMGGIRYSYPNFEESGIRKVLRRSKDLTQRKATDIIENVMNLLYNSKNIVTKDMVLKHVGSGRSNLFLLAVYGGTTHIGCAMAYWVSYHADEKNKGYDLYSTALVCNLSAQPVAGHKVYETDPGPSRRLDHLPKHYSSTHETTTPRTAGSTTRTSSSTLAVNSGCHKNNQKSENPSVLLMPTINIQEGTLTDELPKLNQVRPTEQPSKVSKQRMLNVRDRYFNKDPIPKQEYDVDKILRPNKGHVSSNQVKIPSSTKHSSIFTRVAAFELPSQHHKSNDKINSRDNLPLKRRVHTSQKLSKADLVRLEELVSEYFIKKESRPHNSPANAINPLISTLMQFLDSYPSVNTIDILNPNHRKLREQKNLSDLNHNFPNRNSKNSNDEVDDKLLKFLYNLVEASGIDFNVIIDETMHIIQGNKENSTDKEWLGKKNSDIVINTEKSHVDGKPELNTLMTRRQHPLLQYDKEVNGNIRNNYHIAGGENNYRLNKYNFRNSEDLLPATNINSHNKLLDKTNMNDYYKVFEEISKKRKYLRENLDRSERNPINRRNYRRQKLLNLADGHFMRPVMTSHNEQQNELSVANEIYIANRARPQLSF